MNREEERETMSLQTIEPKIRELAEGFKGRIAYRIEDDHGCFIEYHGEEAFQSASLIKLPIIIEGYRQSEQKKNLSESASDHSSERNNRRLRSFACPDE